jgi:ribonuclease HI
LIYEHRSSIQS